MTGTSKKARAGEIFKNKTYLHLVIWDRFCDKSHTRGLTLMKEIVKEFDLVMPMLRPLGRTPHNYSDDFKTKFKKPPPNELCDVIPLAPLLRGNYTGHCELWVQVADSFNCTVVDFLRERIKKKDSLFGVFLDRENPIWQPLGDSMQKCDYAVARDGLGTTILCDIGEGQQAAFLKLIWYRSSMVIAEWFSMQPQNISWIEPLEQRDVLYDLMNKIFADIAPRKYGISSSFDSIDPSAFGVAHMAAFAINAITKVSHVYQIEQYFGNNITRPYSYPSREEFLKAFRS